MFTDGKAKALICEMTSPVEDPFPLQIFPPSPTSHPKKKGPQWQYSATTQCLSAFPFQRPLTSILKIIYILVPPEEMGFVHISRLWINFSPFQPHSASPSPFPQSYSDIIKTQIAWEIWVWDSALLLGSCVDLGWSVNLSGPLFPHSRHDATRLANVQTLSALKWFHRKIIKVLCRTRWTLSHLTWSGHLLVRLLIKIKSTICGHGVGKKIWPHSLLSVDCDLTQQFSSWVLGWSDCKKEPIILPPYIYASAIHPCSALPLWDQSRDYFGSTRY